jgi:hypothetical protein
VISFASSASSLVPDSLICLSSCQFAQGLFVSEAQTAEASDRNEVWLIVIVASSSAIVIAICFCFCVIFLIVRRLRNAGAKPTDILHQKLTLDGDEDSDDHTSIVTITVPGMATTAWAFSDDTVVTQL